MKQLLDKSVLGHGEENLSQSGPQHELATRPRAVFSPTKQRHALKTSSLKSLSVLSESEETSLAD